jgi:Ca2+-binding EF-hand superfamily protein
MTTAVANNRIKQRFDRWDTDGDGALERADFEREAANIAEAFGKNIESPQGRALRNAFRSLFDYHACKAGVCPDGRITEEQFLDIYDRLMFQQGESSFNRVLRPVMQALIGLCDNDNNGRINRAEFATWLRGLGVSATDARTTFDRIDTNGDGELTVEELLTAVRDFHYGRLDAPMLGSNY